MEISAQTKILTQAIFTAAIDKMGEYKFPAALMTEGASDGPLCRFGWSGKAFGYGGFDTGLEGIRKGEEIANDFVAKREWKKLPARDEAEEKAASVLRDCPALDAIWNKIDRPVFRHLPLASYVGGADILLIPPASAFGGANEIRMIELHELAHWTGSRDRLDRRTRRHDFLTDVIDGQEGQTIAAALEEITAEAASFIILSQIAPDTAAAVGKLIAFRIATHIAHMTVIYKKMELAKRMKEDNPQLFQLVNKLDARMLATYCAQDWKVAPDVAKIVSTTLTAGQFDGAEAAEYLMAMGRE